jgi:MFS family permease
MAGTSISMLGSRVSAVAFPLLVLHFYASPTIAGFAAFVAVAPSVLFYIPAGVFVDRWDPRATVLVSETCRGCAILSVVCALLIFRSHTSLPLLIAAMIVEEIFEIFSTLAERRFLQMMMDEDNRASRQASIETRSHLAVLVGRPLGPFLFSLNPAFPFLADVESFIVSILSLMMIKGSSGSPGKKRDIKSGLWNQLSGDARQSVAWLLRDRRALVIMLILAATTVVAQALILILLADTHTGGIPAVSIGFVLAASGAGGIVGSIISKALQKSTARRLPWKLSWLTFQAIAWIAALGLLAIPETPLMEFSMLAMFVLGLTGALGNIEFGIYVAGNVPNDMTAKVTSFGQMLTIGASAVGPILGGTAIRYDGTRGAVMILSIIMIVVLLASLFVPHRTKAALAQTDEEARQHRRDGSTTQLCRPILGSLPATTAGAPLADRDRQSRELKRSLVRTGNAPRVMASLIGARARSRRPGT